MSDFIPMNELDRAIMAVARTRTGMAALYRELVQGELWFLVRYHPEIEGEVMPLKSGSPLPFARLADSKGEVVPLFSSEARVEEGLKNGHVLPRTFTAGAMPAVQLLEVLGKAGLRAVLNKSCGTGELTLPADLMRDLADGSAFKPAPSREKVHGKLKVLNPADYPTDLIQSVFEFVRRHRNFRAAWVFGMKADAPPAQCGYQLLFLMEPRDPAIMDDLTLTIQAARAKAGNVELGLLDETDAAYIENVFRQAPAFYTAADYRRPPGGLA